ncbi:hypothetical protein KAFR_0B00500 [Kazachstania africana CBS 2517]|uniref:Uncharacterized protein n=1 Tax=Kazachstania africana (strain ATCC 22294 / BCRC 22015 / CBS 2517 / CECT 1963 / NBRC 1671 / NRRL Y-8276) TaxID=1071382 RepID=H2APP9_KAZAF|nr:hypothetical protein KAFR_0B00500 [Kazachstania africana CBS 2517]CCF56349.1 hypothetical protein KAFR_0B00500 [Kazachstania africana CBS 2517]
MIDISELPDSFWFTNERTIDRDKVFFNAKDANRSGPQTFTCQNVQIGCAPRWCWPYRYSKNGRIQYINSIKRDPNMELKSYAPEEVIKEVLEPAIRREKDPETLDDSDLDILVDDEDSPLPDVDDMVAEQHDESQNDNNMTEKLDFIDTHLIVGDDSFHLNGSIHITKIRDNINDCKVFRLDERTDILLIAQRKGLLISIIPSIENNEQSKIIQYWNLGSNGNWNIVKHDSNKEFVVVDEDNRVIKFFKFDNNYRFQLTNNLLLDDYKIMPVTFFPSISDSHFLLFVPTIRFQRIVYLCIEWDSEANVEEQKKHVHQLTYLNGEQINGTIPLDTNKCLVFSNNSISMVSANQIMSGETSFFNVKLSRFLKGLMSWFSAPSFLSRLQKLNPKDFQHYTYCNILFTTTGFIHCCLTNESNINFIPLARLKGLKTMAPVSEETLSTLSETNYEFMVTSFNKTIQIRLDLLTLLKYPTSSNAIPNINIILSRKTIDVSADNNTELAKINLKNQTSSIWTFAPSSISQVDTLNMRRVTEVTSNLSRFKLYNIMKIIKINYSDHWVNFLGIDPIANSDYVIIYATDNANIFNIYLLIIPLDEKEVSIIELDDLLDSELADNILLDVHKNACLIHVQKKRVTFELINDVGDEMKYFVPGWDEGIDGAFYKDDKLIVWSVRDNRVLYLDSIDDSLRAAEDLIPLKESSTFHDFLLARTDETVKFSIDKTNEDIIVVILTTYDGIHIVDWNHFIRGETKYISSRKTPVKDLVILENTFVYLSQGTVLQCTDKVSVLSSQGDINVPKLPFTAGKDLQLRKMNSNSVLAFSDNKVVMLEFPYDKRPIMYEIKLPYQGKLNPIMNIETDANNKIFILYADGMKVYELSSFTKLKNNYLLRYTKSNNKKFLYLSKINRLLVVTLDHKDWNCVKLENGKVLNLPTDIFDAQRKLLNVVELPFENKENIMLLFVFEDMIELVRIIPLKNRIKVEKVTAHEFDSRILGDVVVNEKNNSFYVLEIGQDDDNSNGDSKMDKFINMEFDEDENLTILKEYKFYGKGRVKNFSIIGDNIVVTTYKRDEVFVFPNFSRNVDQEDKIKNGIIKSLSLPQNCSVIGVEKINECIVAVIVHIEGRVEFLSRILFYYFDDTFIWDADTINSMPSTYETNHHDDAHLSVFDSVEPAMTVENDDLPAISQAPNLETEMDLHQFNLDDIDENLVDELDFPYSVENDVSYPCSKPRPAPMTMAYDSIDFDRSIRNVSYDRQTQTLLVLTFDQTIIEFAMGKNAKISHRKSELAIIKKAQENNGYYIPPTMPTIRNITGVPMTDIDDFGRLNLD